MAIEALKSVGAVYQASSTPEIAKEVSQPYSLFGSFLLGEFPCTFTLSDGYSPDILCVHVATRF